MEPFGKKIAEIYIGIVEEMPECYSVDQGLVHFLSKIKLEGDPEKMEIKFIRTVRYYLSKRNLNNVPHISGLLAVSLYIEMLEIRSSSEDLTFYM